MILEEKQYRQSNIAHLFCENSLHIDFVSEEFIC